LPSSKQSIIIMVCGGSSSNKPSTDTSGQGKHVGFAWHAKSLEDCLVELGLDAASAKKTGLSAEQAEARLELYGHNKLSEQEKVTLLQRIWNQVANVLVAILVFVAIVSGIRAATGTLFLWLINLLCILVLFDDSKQQLTAFPCLPSIYIHKFLALLYIIQPRTRTISSPTGFKSD
jgi:magnesium-transporting ATPase (P-type)